MSTSVNSVIHRGLPRLIATKIKVFVFLYKGNLPRDRSIIKQYNLRHILPSSAPSFIPNPNSNLGAEVVLLSHFPDDDDDDDHPE